MELVHDFRKRLMMTERPNIEELLDTLAKELGWKKYCLRSHEMEISGPSKEAFVADQVHLLGVSEEHHAIAENVELIIWENVGPAVPAI